MLWFQNVWFLVAESLRKLPHKHLSGEAVSTLYFFKNALDMKKNLGVVLTAIGGVGLTIGIIMLFTGEVTESTPWIAVILGGIFFSSGIGLLKSTKGQDAG